MSWSTWRPLVTAALVGLSAIFAALALGRGPTGSLGGIVGALLLVPLPGYAYSRALFWDRDLDGVERIVLILGLGLGSAILAGIVLSATPAGMTAGSWAGLLAGLSVLALMIGAIREMRSPRSERDARPAGANGARADVTAGWKVRPIDIAMLAAAVLIMVSAVAVARIGAAEQAYPGFTQLWMIPDGTGAVALGVANREGTEQHYTYRVIVDGQTFGEDRSLRLPDGETWEATLVFPLPSADLEVRLFRVGDTEPYRRVSASIDGPDEP